MVIRVDTKRFGTLEVEKEEVIYFLGGIVGFEDREFFFVKNGGPFLWLQSVKSPELAFVVCDPKLFFPNYKITIGKDVLSDLEVKDKRELSIFVIVTMESQVPIKLAANLLAPLLVNFSKRVGRQVVVRNEDIYSTRHILPIQKRGKKRDRLSIFLPKAHL